MSFPMSFAALKGSFHLPTSVFRFVIGYIREPNEVLQSFFPALFSAAFDPDTSIQSLEGKVILVTGGNNGIGRETVLQLAKHKPSKIYLASRTESKGKTAIASIRDSINIPSAVIEYLPLDLSSFESIRSAAKMLQDSTDRLDILIYNAGCMTSETGLTEEGFEIHVGTNHVGHHYLTKLLLPLLEKTAAEPDSDVRILSISSMANVSAAPLSTMLDTEKLAAADMIMRYAASKSANIYFAAELARRYPVLTAISIHPGIIKTDLYNAPQDKSVLFRVGFAMASPFLFITQEKGAHNQLWAAGTAQKAELVNGAYYNPVGVLREDEGNRKAKDAASCLALWEWTESEIAKAGG